MPHISYGRPRLNVDITDEQDRELKKYLPHNTKGLLYRTLTDDLIEMLHIDAPKVIGLIMTRNLRAQAIIKGWADELPPVAGKKKE